MTIRPINKIIVGDRHRKAMGDIAGLAANIAELGLLQPIVVSTKNMLIDGGRRLAAYKHLGRSEIAVHVVDLDAIVRGEFAANTQRKDFLPSEIESIRRVLEPLEKAAAQERMTLGKLSTGSTSGKTRDKIGAFAGVSGKTVEKIRDIVAAAESEPDKYGKLVEDMDRTGRVDGPYKRLKNIQQAVAIRAEPPPLPNKGPYRVIVADPPWPYEKRQEDPSHRGVLPYPSMSIEQICALPVQSIAHDDCILWMWTTNHHMREAFTVLDAWGFQQKTILTWVKDRMGMGDWLRGQTEHCLMAVRGRPTVQLTNQTTVLHGPMRAHSQKPDEFYDFVEKLCPAPRYAYLWSRSIRENWDCHGDEVPIDQYNAEDDFAKSINVAYEAVRERVAAGGPTWTPPPVEPEKPTRLDQSPFILEFKEIKERAFRLGYQMTRRRGAGGSYSYNLTQIDDDSGVGFGAGSLKAVNEWLDVYEYKIPVQISSACGTPMFQINANAPMPPDELIPEFLKRGPE